MVPLLVVVDCGGGAVPGRRGRGKGKGVGGEKQKTKGIFFARKGIPPVLQDVMGVYKDPFTNYANTMMKLYQTKANFQFEKAIR